MQNTKQECCSWEDTMKEATAVQKNIAAHLKFAKEHLDVPQRYCQKIFCGRIKVELLGRHTQHYVWRRKRHSTPTSKPHPNCKVRWREHHGLGLLCCHRAWTACYHRRKNEFLSLSRHFAGEWISTEVGWCNRTTTQITEVNQQQNGFNRRKYAFWSGPVRVLTTRFLKNCGMTSTS